LLVQEAEVAVVETLMLPKVVALAVAVAVLGR
jgi:hypothetical protein